MTSGKFDISSHLPNFLEPGHLLDKLRSAMGAELVAPISNLKIGVMSLDEILRTTGQDVDIEEVEFADDGTFLFQNRRVILHIRDVQSYGHELTLPKYHLANCRTLQQMWQKNRSERYVVSTRQDGVFFLKLSDNGGLTWEDKEQALDVCKNCLSTLNWDSYSNSSNRTSIFKAFSLHDFFDRYPNSPITYTPTHTDITAPVNKYTSDFQEVSKAYRESVGWKCEECLANLNQQNLRQYLHVHHLDGIKSNNNRSNLRALCIECHSKQDHHNHLSHNPDLAAYRKLKNTSTKGYRVI